MKFHENLLRLRAEHKLTQQQVAEGAGLSLRGYQNYERGLREPSLSALVALADFYGLSVEIIFSVLRISRRRSFWKGTAF